MLPPTHPTPQGRITAVLEPPLAGRVQPLVPPLGLPALAVPAERFDAPAPHGQPGVGAQPILTADG